MLLASFGMGSFARAACRVMSRRACSTSKTLRREDRMYILRNVEDIAKMRRKWADEKGKICVFVRHGESKANRARDAAVAADNERGDNETTALSAYEKDPNLIDAGLTEKGIVQATEAKKMAAALEPDILCSSPMTRALQTALVMFEDVLEAGEVVPYVNPDLREYFAHLAECKGRTIGDIAGDRTVVDLPHGDVLVKSLLSSPWGHDWDTTLARGDGYFTHTNDTARFESFRKWVMEQDARVIACVCHWGTSQYFVNRECVTPGGGLPMTYVPLFGQKIHLMDLDNCSFTAALFQNDDAEAPSA